MPYSPEEYEALKAAYRKDLLERKAWLEKRRLTALRRRAEWHLQQVERSLAELGLEERQPPLTTHSPRFSSPPEGPGSFSASQEPSPPQAPQDKTLF